MHAYTLLHMVDHDPILNMLTLNLSLLMEHSLFSMLWIIGLRRLQYCIRPHARLLYDNRKDVTHNGLDGRSLLQWGSQKTYYFCCLSRSNRLSVQYVLHRLHAVQHFRRWMTAVVYASVQCKRALSHRRWTRPVSMPRVLTVDSKKFEVYSRRSHSSAACRTNHNAICHPGL